MSIAYAPLDEVRRSMRVKWYRSPVEPAVLRRLMQRDDLCGALQAVGYLTLAAGTGVLTYWLFTHHPEERAKSVRWARLTLAGHALVIVAGVATGLWLLPVLVSFSIVLGNVWRYFVGAPMHCGLRDNVPDFRKCVRSIRVDPLSTFVYWRMNWHMEHHMYAGVPCYNLRRLRRAMAADLPQARTLFGAWREMRATWKRQQTEPDYQYDTRVPTPGRVAGRDARDDDELGASIGDLAPGILARAGA